MLRGSRPGTRNIRLTRRLLRLTNPSTYKRVSIDSRSTRANGTVLYESALATHRPKPHILLSPRGGLLVLRLFFMVRRNQSLLKESPFEFPHVLRREASCVQRSRRCRSIRQPHYFGSMTWHSVAFHRSSHKCILTQKVAAFGKHKVAVLRSQQPQYQSPYNSSFIANRSVTWH